MVDMELYASSFVFSAGESTSPAGLAQKVLLFAFSVRPLCSLCLCGESG